MFLLVVTVFFLLREVRPERRESQALQWYGV